MLAINVRRATVSRNNQFRYVLLQLDRECTVFDKKVGCQHNEHSASQGVCDCQEYNIVIRVWGIFLYTTSCPTLFFVTHITLNAQ